MEVPFPVVIYDRNGGETALHFAACLGHVDATKALILHRLDVDVVDEENTTPLERERTKRKR